MRNALHHPSSASGRGRKWLKQLGLFCVIYGVTLGLSRAEVTHLSAEQRSVLEDATHFREVHSITNLPAEVVALCEGGVEGIADPGQKWEVGDAIIDGKLSRKRLIWAAVSGNYYVVHYERGGRGHSHHVFLAQYKPGDSKAKALWRAAGGPFKDYKAFLDGLKSNKVDDNPANAH